MGYGPHVDLLRKFSDSTSLYALRITNYSVRTLWLEGYPDQTFGHFACGGILYHVQLQKYDVASRTWSPIDEFGTTPNGEWGATSIVKTRVLPLQSICAGGWRGISGKDFKKGEVGRIVMFPRIGKSADESGKGLYSPSFVVN